MPVEPAYQISLLLFDLRKEETLLHAVRSLELLSAMSQDIFIKISKKIEEVSEKCGALDSRIETAQAKIDRLKEIRKALVVFSSPKYPCKEREYYRSIFYEPFLPPARKLARVTERIPDCDPRKISNKLQRFHVKEPERKYSHPPDSIGDISTNIRSSASLLIFNTGENPFKIRKRIDPLEVILRTRDFEKQPLPQDETDSTARDMTVSNTATLFYTPDFGDLPDFDLPEELELPNIAEGVEFSEAKEPSLMLPSVQLHLFDLPEIPTPAASIQAPSLPSQIQPPPIQAAQPPQPASITSLPPMPPVAVSSSPSVVPVVSAAVEPPTNFVSPVVAPIISETTLMPAVAEQLSPAEAVPAPSATLRESSVSSPAQDGRGSLLEAIRAAGGATGAGLKSAKERKVVERKRREEEKSAVTAVSSTGGDLMGDLMSKLAMRRKGISGTAEQQQPVSTMDRISLMIPPPPTDAAASADTDSDNDDWE